MTSTIALPLTLGLASYLNARYHLTEDLDKLRLLITGKITGALRERRDTVNTFYTLEALARQTPERPFLIFEGKSFTYGEAYDKALRYGTWLKTRFGVRSDEVVAMDCMNSDTFVWLWFGLWAIGAKPAFINYNLRGEGLAHCIRTSGSRLLLVDDEVWNELDDGTKSILATPDFVKPEPSPDQVDAEKEAVQAPLPLETIPLTQLLLATIDAVLPQREPNSARGGQLLKTMAALIYTSGTTGLPKPAVVSWGKASVSPHVMAKLMGLRADDVFYTCMPLYHSSAALLGLCSVLATGCTLSLGRKFQRQRFWTEVRASRATVIQYVGETCRYLLTLPESEADTQHSVRMAFGNGLRPDVWRRFKHRFGIETIVEFYAATEGPSAFFNRSSNSFAEGAVGITGPLLAALMGATATVVKVDDDAEGTDDAALLWRDPRTRFCALAAPNEPGALLYKLNIDDLDGQFQGYYKNAGATSKKVLRHVLSKGDAYFSTGDVLRRDEEGRWYFCDRMGDTFRWKSENVSTSEVAEVLGRVVEGESGRAVVEEANVYGVQVPGSEDGRAGCAAILLAPPSSSATSASSPEISPSILATISAALHANLPRYAVPVFLRALSEQSALARRTGTNKLQKHVLRDEGVDPDKISASGDVLYWLRPAEEKSKAGEYRLFGLADWNALKGGKVLL